MQSDVPLDSSSIIEQLLSAPPYSLGQTSKSPLLMEELRSLTAGHRQDCEPYRRILDGLGRGDSPAAASYAEIPFLPVRLFKNSQTSKCSRWRCAQSVDLQWNNFTAGFAHLPGRQTSMLQTRALASIVTSFIGPKRLPMIIVDSASVLRNRDSMNARGAGLVWSLQFRP